MEAISNEDGEVTFTLTVGDTYDILTTKEGYLSSDEDFINNDVFTVPEIKE